MGDPSQIDGGQRAAASSEELAQIKALKAENRRLREDVEILRGYLGSASYVVCWPGLKQEGSAGGHRDSAD